MSSVGAVVGATSPRAVSEARPLAAPDAAAPPGVGAQGATPADVARAFTSGPASALVTASRSVIFAFRDTEDDWRVAAAGAANGSRLRCGPRPDGEHARKMEAAAKRTPSGVCATGIRARGPVCDQ